MFLLLILTFCFPAQAHHGFRGYESKSTSVSGTVVEVNYANPHVSIKLKTPNDDQPYDVLFPPPWSMISRGLPEEKLPEGASATVVGNLNRHDSHELLAAEMEIGGKSTVFRGGLSDTEVSHAMHSNPWLFPLIEIFHIIAFSLLVGATAVFDFRLLRVGCKIRVTDLAKVILPFSLGVFSVALISGGLLFLSDVNHYLGNRAFQIKLILLVLAGTNAAVFQFMTFKSVDSWDLTLPPRSAKLAGAISLFLWFGIIIAGRLIAFV